MTPTDTDQSQSTKKNRGWIYYFLVLAGLTAIAVATMIIYNLSQQLTEAQLQQQIAKWNEKRPKNYELTYTTLRGTNKKPDQFNVRVKHGVVVSVTLNGMPLKYKQLKNHNMDALLRDIKRFMDYDAEPGRAWTFTRAIFDPDDGHLKWYVRNVRWSDERIEIQVTRFEPTGK